MLFDFLAGYSVEEIARKLGIAADAAQDRLRRALYDYGFSAATPRRRRSTVTSIELPELDASVRRAMRSAYDRDVFHPPVLTAKGLLAFRVAMIQAVERGSIASLAHAVASFPRTYLRQTKDKTNTPRPRSQLVISEYLALYNAGYAHYLIERKERYGVIASLSTVAKRHKECRQHVGLAVPLRAVAYAYRSRSARHPLSRRAFALPANANCCHGIRRMQPDEVLVYRSRIRVHGVQLLAVQRR